MAFILPELRRYIKNLIGRELLTINGYTVDQISNSISKILSYDNATGLLTEIASSLSNVNILDYCGITSEENLVLKTVYNLDTLTTEVTPIKESEYDELVMTRGTDCLYTKKRDEYYWNEYFPSNELLFVKIDRISNSKSGSGFMDYFENLFEEYSDVNLSRLIIDLRNNPGGDDPIYRPFLAKLLHFIELKNLNSSRAFYVITGRETASAAQHLINDLEYLTNATFIGETTQQSVHFFSDSRYFKLPNSKIEYRVSTGWLQNFNPSPYESRSQFEPDISISISSTDYFNDIDPIVEYILKVK